MLGVQLTIMADTRVLPPSSKPPTVAAKTDVNAEAKDSVPRTENMEGEVERKERKRGFTGLKAR
jgi:hypothetical protein